jgi:NAD(P)-dependent dehydrogenase (short-subunit alcohol dehydrogenase family)
MSDTAVVVAAGPGLGAAVARRLVRDGARVALLARSPERTAALAAEVGSAGPGLAVPFPADAGDEESLRSAFAEVRRRLGDPTVLVHNPSVTIEGAATATPDEALLGAIRVSVGSLLVSAQEVAPAMRAAGRGTLLVTGSRAALAGSTWSAAVGVQKAAVRNLALSLAAELGPAGIHVATVTIFGTLGRPGYEVDAVAEEYARLVAETDGPRAAWRTEVEWRAAPR